MRSGCPLRRHRSAAGLLPWAGFSLTGYDLGINVSPFVCRSSSPYAWEGFLRNHLLLILLGICTFSGCGGGGSPSVSFSAKSLTFGSEVEGTASEPLLITFANSGTAPLTIMGTAASANFAETNNCGTTLAAGANCAINVTLAPNTTGSVTGTVTFTDNAAGSPQAVSLSGTAVTPSTLTGLCVSPAPAQGDVCVVSEDTLRCPVGQPAVTPLSEEARGCAGNPLILDTSTPCFAVGHHSGVCQATSAVGSCSVQGQQCGAAGSSPCCSGFACTAAGGVSSCQPTAGESASSRARSSWDQRMADSLE
jgi:hypothetical protein